MNYRPVIYTGAEWFCNLDFIYKKTAPHGGAVTSSFIFINFL